MTSKFINLPWPAPAPDPADVRSSGASAHGTGRGPERAENAGDGCDGEDAATAAAAG
ncbi:hypothetical protein ACF09H_29535 [Streptomyces sp. NPDC014983]|uniref:hypothetical protein n=1 Tax=Streptomyces sp. NPDC014983 TaxID=3364933 RepID=UPI0036FB02E3